MEKKLSYEEASNELASIISRLEDNSVTMDDAVKLFERGKELIKTCSEHLDKAKGKLTEIKETLDGLEEV